MKLTDISLKISHPITQETWEVEVGELLSAYDNREVNSQNYSKFAKPFRVLFISTVYSHHHYHRPNSGTPANSFMELLTVC